MKIIKKLVFCFFLALLTSCESNTYQDISVAVATPTYTTNVASIINAKCVGCHATGAQLPALDSYSAVKTATNSGNLICRIEASCGSVMPPGDPLPQASIDMIKLWKTQGFAN
ncbi:hypothetical protein B0A58_00805 [Flavobacterium branchiophilum NBRC 15030 = ATCC 35035]|uniref:Cytochrome c domain-containing protein n=2 Tax=Flavobacterium branchiophilum TaxID=55197 RepID=G2Z261_FLABF|nr:hypothetical protein [Flavobacterium branchiophilum]OXA81996.1 hypothetical protein B0A58_00805 [Flavobacterium branchiophilum NBRC 15030 = ATCC 35035]TQM39264.1 hypothetical protein BC670_0038 [Flavobacterium branchiophilum]GEM54102.1 hypothetical protein FB1_03230 [Flavobacterium branchiophilum NBRC 15030 = ATCC 35035]CCB70016.1 Protein of unknown function precursor [Flavobacterium branchiophilum FL-15]